MAAFLVLMKFAPIVHGRRRFRNEETNGIRQPPRLGLPARREIATSQPGSPGFYGV
jgi:hypothetical protein